MVVQGASFIEGIVKYLGLRFDDPREYVAPDLRQGIFYLLAVRRILAEFPAFNHEVKPFTDHHVFAFTFVIESGIFCIVSVIDCSPKFAFDGVEDFSVARFVRDVRHILSPMFGLEAYPEPVKSKRGTLPSFDGCLVDKRFTFVKPFFLTFFSPGRVPANFLATKACRSDLRRRC